MFEKLSISYKNDLYMAILTALHLQGKGLNKYTGSEKEFIFIIVIVGQIRYT
jgi:hypothetical protein